MPTKIFFLPHLLFVVFISPMLSQVAPKSSIVTNAFLGLKAKSKSEKFILESFGKQPLANNILSGKGELFNNNPSIIFNGNTDQLSIPYPENISLRHTLFIVYKVKDSNKEQFLWEVSDAKNLITTATNKRLVDLKNYNYRTYDQKIGSNTAQIHFYQQNKSNSKAKDYVLNLGSKPKTENLPPIAFDGSLSEILLYDRVLSSSEAQIVASYLAIKYGISLSQFETKNYLNSRGEIIWDASKHKDFQNSITAIGRDNHNNLLQLKSSNMANEGLLTIAINNKSENIPDNYFAFWSDNGKNLLVKRQEEGYPKGIARQWKLDFDSKSGIMLDWTFDGKAIKGDFKEDDYYWLLVDYSGQGTYKEKDVAYINLGSVKSKELLKLDNFEWDKQQTGKIEFTIKVAPEMFAQVWIDQPTCGTPISGKLNYAIQGGTAPFTVTVYPTKSDMVLKQWQQENNTAQSIDIESGSYDYVVRDAKGAQYKETVFVTDKNALVPILDNYYFIKKGATLVLDGSHGLSNEQNQYEWYLENNFLTTNAALSIQQSGAYELRLTNTKGCKSATKIVVEMEENGNLLSENTINLYPNPAVDGYFTAAINFPEKTDLTISIRNSIGATLKETKLFDIENYNYKDQITTATGIYLITFRTNLESKTYKLIVK